MKCCKKTKKETEKKKDTNGILLARKTRVGNISLFELYDIPEYREEIKELWEREYELIMDPKYKKGTRNYTKHKGIVPRYFVDPPIFVVPRERGGASYKSVPLMMNKEQINSNDVIYCAVSKGYGMQDVSSFTLGPVVGEGLCIVNAAFSKVICIFHLEGNGYLDTSRKNYWRQSKTPKYKIRIIEEYDGEKGIIEVDRKKYNTKDWLKDNEKEWKANWEEWRKHVALCSLGWFHWDNDEIPVAFGYKNEYIGFVEWKKKCYIQPAYDLLEDNSVFLYLKGLRDKGCALALVHPMGRKSRERNITKDTIRQLYDDKYTMSCLPYCVAGKLLGIDI